MNPFYPSKNEDLWVLDLEKLANDISVVGLDLKDFLVQELLLKEAKFREDLKKHDWTPYQDNILAVYCSSDAILAPWAFMLVATHAQAHCEDVVFGSPKQVLQQKLIERIRGFDFGMLAGKRVLIKGCGSKIVDESAYLEATKALMSVAKRVMYGEACSFVPVFKAQSRAGASP